MRKTEGKRGCGIVELQIVNVRRRFRRPNCTDSTCKAEFTLTRGC